MTPYEEIVTLTQQAQQATDKGNYHRALEAYGQSIKLARALNRPQLVAALFDQWGRSLEQKGNVQQAVIAYESALMALTLDDADQADELPNKLSQVGKGYAVSSEPVPDLYSPPAPESLDAAEDDRAFQIKLLINVGNNYFRQIQENPALNAYQLALTDGGIETQPLLKAYIKSNIGEIYRRQDNLEQAKHELTGALALFEKEGDPLQKRRALAILARVEHNLNQPEQAIERYAQAIDLYKEARDTQGRYASTLAGLAYLHILQNDFLAAEPLYQQTLDLAQTSKNEEILWHVYWGVGRCQYHQGDIAAAIKSFEASLPLIERRQDQLQTDEGKVTFFDSVKDVFDQLLTAHLVLAQNQKVPDFSAALAVAEKARGRALEDLMNGRNRRRWAITRSNGGIDKTMHEGAIAMANMPPDASIMVDQCAPSTPEEDLPFCPVEQRAVGTFTTPVEDIKDSEGISSSTVSESEKIEAPPLARLVFHVLLDKTAIFAVAPNGTIKGHIADIGRYELERRIAELRSALQVDGASRSVKQTLEKTIEHSEQQPVEHSDERKATVIGLEPLTTQTVSAIDLEQLLQSFYTDLVAPVADALPTEQRPLVIEPHSSLWLLPFAALKAPNGTWMSDQWPLLYAPSLQTLEEIRQEPCYASLEDSQAVVVGNPVMPTVPTIGGVNLRLSNLPGAEKEAKAIGKVLQRDKTQLLIGAEATEDRVKALSQTHNIMHLATHGIAYMGDPLASFVAFSPTETENGLLTAREVAMNRYLPLDLVVLSACQTGLGKVSGDGMLGLSRAFLIAGARTVVVSQWSVSDAATAALMVAFYQAYSQDGQKVIALQKAMQTVREMPNYAHPRYWSAFISVGAEN